MPDSVIVDISGKTPPPDGAVSPSAEDDAECARIAKLRADALLRAEEADREAAAVQEEIDAALARLQAAKERAAKERAAAQPPGAEDDQDDESSDVGDFHLHEALLQQEASVLLNLHAQAVAVQNIRSLVPLVLDINSTFYGRWK